jgi:chitinase
VKLYLAAGVPAAKLGIGIGFFGLCYSSPVTGPDQALNGSTIVASDGTMSYANIMTEYYSASARQWDSLARVPYLSFSTPHAPDGCTYISYDDEQSIAEKGAYMKANGLGGVIQWELNEGYLPLAAAGQQNPLLTAIHDNVLH